MGTKKNLGETLEVKTWELEKLELEEFTAIRLSQDLKLSRTIVSQYLNELVKEGVLVKTSNRPVCFFSRNVLEKMYNLKSNELNKIISIEELNSKFYKVENYFENVIGFDGSIQHCIEQCKSAIMHPPNGLPILLTGPTGSGKSYLSSILYKYALQMGIININGKFITLNCSEFANNPELLTGNLFGYKKGAFTGATSDSIGLIEAADGGVLFLDEVHSLSPECQEKLFVFLDKGEYHKLGDNEKSIKANVKIIFATSEEPKSVLLKTLIRRIPVIVKLPALEERSIEEKEKLILTTIKQEENKIGKKILISSNVFQALMSYKFQGNIGELKDCIRLGCANSYSYTSNQNNSINLTIMNMPDYIIEEIGTNGNGMMYDNKMIDIEHISNSIETENTINLYKEIVKKCMENSIDSDKLIKSISRALNEHYDYLIYNKRYINKRIELLENIIIDIQNEVAEKVGFLKNASNEKIIARVIYEYMQKASYFKVWEYNNRIKINKCIEIFKQILPQQFDIATDIINHIQRKLEVELGDINIIIILINIYMTNVHVTRNRVIAVILCHGHYTASSIADASNKIVGNYIFQAIDMPLDIPTIKIGEKLNEIIEQKSTYKDAIFLVDMGSLEDIYKYVKDNYKGNIGIINGVNTRMAVEVAISINNGMELKDIVEKVSSNNISTYKLFENVEKEDAILFVNEVDIHAAKRMMELFKNSLTHNIKVKFIPFDYYTLLDKKNNTKIFNEYNVVGIIGSINPYLENIKYIPVEGIIEGTAKADINELLSSYLNKRELLEFNANMLKNFSLQNVIERITILNVKIVLDDVEKALNRLQKMLNINMSNKALIGLYVHICYLIERLIKKIPIETHENLDRFEKDEFEFIKSTKKSFSDVENRYSVEIPISEIAYIHGFINTEY